MKLRIIRSIVVMFSLLPLAAISTPSPHGNDVSSTRSACSSAWDNSYASINCRNPSISTNGNFCYISAKCGTSDGHDRQSSITAHISDVSRLNNCDGHLKIGGC